LTDDSSLASGGSHPPDELRGITTNVLTCPLAGRPERILGGSTL
jgi:hypothetical protein